MDGRLASPARVLLSTRSRWKSWKSSIRWTRNVQSIKPHPWWSIMRKAQERQTRKEDLQVNHYRKCSRRRKQLPSRVSGCPHNRVSLFSLFTCVCGGAGMCMYGSHWLLSFAAVLENSGDTNANTASWPCLLADIVPYVRMRICPRNTPLHLTPLDTPTFWIKVSRADIKWLLCTP